MEAVFLILPTCMAAMMHARHRKPSIQRSVLLIKTELGDSLMHSGLLENSSVPSIPLFIHPLPLTRLHAVDIREMHASNSPGKRLFSTQMDYSAQRINKRRARESLWAFLKQTISVVLNHAARKIVIRGLVYWHFPGPRIAVPFFINEILTHKLEDMPKKYSG